MTTVGPRISELDTRGPRTYSNLAVGRLDARTRCVETIGVGHGLSWQTPTPESEPTLNLSRRPAGSLGLSLLASTTALKAADFAHVLSRGTTPTLRGYKIEANGTIPSVISTNFPASTFDNSTLERRVLAYSSREKVLLVGLVDKLMVYRVEASGLLTPSSPPEIDFPGNQIDAVEIVEVGNKTFAYVGEAVGTNGIYGYRILPNGSVIGIAGFPVATQNPMTDLASNGSKLFSAQPGNNFVYMFGIAADGTLSEQGVGRPESVCSQIEIKPGSTTLLANSMEQFHLQQFTLFKKDDNLDFSGMFAMEVDLDQPTAISLGKKYVAVARHSADISPDVRLLGLDSAGRARVVHFGLSTSGINLIDSIALIRNDSLLLVVSEADDKLVCFETAPKTASINVMPIDTEAIPGLADFTTMLAIQR